MVVRFLVRLKNLERLTPRDISEISGRASTHVEPHRAQVGNIRVSSTAVEMDLFPPNVRDAAALAQRLEEEFGEILTLRQLDLPTPPPPSGRDVIALARNLFNEERFWETHEEVEALWKTKSGEEKQFLQGFILVAVAFVHLQKDEREICLSVLRRAQKKLEGALQRYESLDLGMLRRNVETILNSGVPQTFKV